MIFDNFHFTKPLLAFAFSVNFMVLCSYCATLGRIGNESCKNNEDCVPGAYCVEIGHCMCDKEFVADRASQSCLPISKKINDPCKIDLQCTSTFGTHAICFKNFSMESGQCKCMRNTHFEDGLCYKSVPLGGECKVSDNCVSASNVPTYCARSRCVCAANHHPSEDRLDCLPDIGLGEKCKNNEECVADHSYCSGVCLCQTGYTVSRNKTVCLNVAKRLRDLCVEDSQCLLLLPNTFCDSQENNCKCLPYSHELNNTCWISAKLGEKCSHPNQCTTASMNRSTVVCNQGICSCLAGYMREHSDCVRLQDSAADSSKLEKFVFVIIAVVLLSLPNEYI